MAAQVKRNGMQYAVETGMQIGFLYEKHPLMYTARRGTVMPNNPRVSSDRVVTLDVGGRHPKAFSLSKIVGDISQI